MKSKFTKFTRHSLVLVFAMFVTNLFSANYYSQGNGNFNNLANWNTNPGGGGSTPSSIIAQTDSYFIQTGHNITVNDSVNIAALDITGTLTFGDDATARSMWVNGSITVNSEGSMVVSAFSATHKLTINGGNLINNGTINFRPTSSSRVVNLSTRGTVSLQGTNTPILNNLTVVANTTTAAVALNIKGNFTISNTTTFNAGAFTHQLSGNFSTIGTFNCNTSTFQFNAPLVQSISTTGTFYNVTINGGGIVSINSNLTVGNDFLVSNNSSVTTSANNRFDRNWEVQAGSEYKALDNQTQFYGATAQNITIAGTVEFYQLIVQYAGVKTVYGNLIVRNQFYVTRVLL